MGSRGEGGEDPIVAFWGFYKLFDAAFLCVFFVFLFVGSTTLDSGMKKSFESFEYG